MYSYIPLLLSAIWTDYMHTHIRYIVCYQEGEEWVTFQKIPYYINGFTFLLDQSLIVWRKNSWNPQRVSSVFTFSCLSVCMLATEHTFWPRNLIFGLSDPWYMRKKHFFYVSKYPYTFILLVYFSIDENDFLLCLEVK